LLNLIFYRLRLLKTSRNRQWGKTVKYQKCVFGSTRIMNHSSHDECSVVWNIFSVPNL